MNADERLNRIAPFHFVAKWLERLELSILQDWKRLHDSISQNREKVRVAVTCRLQHVTRKVTMMRALLDNHEVVGFAESFPHFRELRSQQLSKKRTDAHVREVIAAPPDRAPARGIISVPRMIEHLLHEPSKRDRAAVFNFRADKVD